MIEPYFHQAKRKESEKLPDFYKIDCVTVSATPFRAAVEDHMQRLSDTLVFSLRRRVTDLLNSLEEYLNGAPMASLLACFMCSLSCPHQAPWKG